MKPSPPTPKRCPQCGNMECGPISCRFSGLQHKKVSPETLVGVGCLLAIITERALTFAGVIA